MRWRATTTVLEASRTTSTWHSIQRRQSEGDIYSGDGHLRGLFDGSSDDMVEDLTGSSSDARPGPVPSAVCDLASNRGKGASLNGPSRSTASSSGSTTAGDGDFGGGNGHYPMYSSARFSSNDTDASGRYQGTAAPFTPQPMGSMGHVSAGYNGGGGTRNGPPTDFGSGASSQPWGITRGLPRYVFGPVA